MSKKNKKQSANVDDSIVGGDSINAQPSIDEALLINDPIDEPKGSDVELNAEGSQDQEQPDLELDISESSHVEPILKVKNALDATYQVFNTDVLAGKKYTVTSSDKKSIQGMKRLQRAIDLGHLVEC